MAATNPKQTLLTTALKLLSKKYTPASDAPATRPVLEELIYALCREAATTEQAEAAYRRLKENFFDWNEVRVSTVPETADALAGLPEAGPKAKRLIEFLQELFEADYTFSLEGMEKKGLKQAAKQLGRYQGVTDFAVAWVTQRSFGGHAVPMDEPTLRVLRRLRVVDPDVDDLETLRGTIEHYISKTDGITFTEVVTELAAAICIEGRPLCEKCPLKNDCPTGIELLAKKPDSKPKPKAKG